jgi:hypothetical protein
VTFTRPEKLKSKWRKNELRQRFKYLEGACVGESSKGESPFWRARFEPEYSVAVLEILVKGANVNEPARVSKRAEAVLLVKQELARVRASTFQGQPSTTVRPPEVHLPLVHGTIRTEELPRGVTFLLNNGRRIRGISS